MFQIHKIDKKGYRYQFPTIDFKFQNTGDATAFIWKFKIDILEAEIDITPKFDFEYSVAAGNLIIKCINNGWGSANSCKLTINEPTLNQVFDQSDLHRICDVKGTGGQTIFRLKPAISLQKFLDILEGNSRKPIYSLGIEWECRDDIGFSHKGFDWIKSNHSDGGVLFLDRDKFEFHPHSVLHSPVFSNVTYTTIIDPLQELKSKEYSILRKIPPGDVERFHIMIGATRSCKLKLQFSFLIDTNKSIKSDCFLIDIWNPYDSQWHHDYRDGSELARMFYDINRKADEQRSHESTEEICQSQRALLSRYFLRDPEILQRFLANYPFTLQEELRKRHFFEDE
jgi:hypothetical protein